jgi:hypothetical protein
MGFEDGYWTRLTKDCNQCQGLVNTVMKVLVQ